MRFAASICLRKKKRTSQQDKTVEFSNAHTEESERYRVVYLMLTGQIQEKNKKTMYDIMSELV